MKHVLSAAVLLIGLSVPGLALADSIYGKCIGKGGEKCQTHHRISTSWNGKTGVINASSGTYELDLGGTVGKRITVYCDGNNVGSVVVKGRTKYTVICQ